jgi:hypothetical protein
MLKEMPQDLLSAPASPAILGFMVDGEAGASTSSQLLLTFAFGPMSFAFFYFVLGMRRKRNLSAELSAAGGVQKEGGTRHHSGKVEWWDSPLANQEEEALIAAARKLIVADGLEPLPRYVDLELLRQVRAMGTRTSAEALAAAYGSHLRWRRTNVLRPMRAFPAPGEARPIWYASSEHAHGEWARSRVELGLCIGRAKGGHPVKLERIGKARMGDVCAEVHGSRRLLDHYYSLLETMLVGLNAESVNAGRLLRMYEVMDLGGLSVWQTTMGAIKTITQLLTVVVGVYAETTCRAVLINLPRSVAYPVRAILAILPERVACRVLVLGEGEVYDFASELDETAVRMLHASGPELAVHIGTPMVGTPEADPAEQLPGRPCREVERTL